MMVSRDRILRGLPQPVVACVMVRLFVPPQPYFVLDGKESTDQPLGFLTVNQIHGRSPISHVCRPCLASFIRASALPSVLFYLRVVLVARMAEPGHGWLDMAPPSAIAKTGARSPRVIKGPSSFGLMVNDGTAQRNSAENLPPVLSTLRDSLPGRLRTGRRRGSRWPSSRRRLRPSG